MTDEHSAGLAEVLDALQTIERARKTLDPVELQEQYQQLEELRDRVDFHLLVVESALRAANAWSRPGRPRKAPTHTPQEAKEAHRLWVNGERSPWIEAGHRQYERENRRQRRLEAAARMPESTPDTPKEVNEG